MSGRIRAIRGGKAYRSRNNWAHHYVDWLNARGAHTTLTNLAHSGSTTSDVMNGQIGKMSVDTDLVMLTIGGNDVRFGDIVKRCFSLGFRSASGCREVVENADSRMESEAVEGGTAVPSVRTQTRTILEKIDAKLPDGAQWCWWATRICRWTRSILSPMRAAHMMPGLGCGA